jgi:hypothetical protein
MPDMAPASFRSDDPGAAGPGRVVADVLIVAALQFGYPIVVLVLMKPDDFASNHVELWHLSEAGIPEKRRWPHMAARTFRRCCNGTADTSCKLHNSN